MCGRARCSLRADDIPRACRRNHGSVRTIHMDRYSPSYNVAPGFNVPVVRREDGGAEDGGVVLECMKWGLIPSFTKKSEKPDHYRMFNARSESIGEKASFRRLIPKNRCLVAIEGFYEWKKDGSKKQPYYVHFKDGRPLVLAALYDSWENSDGEILHTFTIVTTSSSSGLAWLHDRMPVILGHSEASEAWLNCSSSKVDTLLKPHEDTDLVWYPVTPEMGKPSFNGPECIAEIKLKTHGNTPISKFFTAKRLPKQEAELNPDENLPKLDKSGTVKDEPKFDGSETVKDEPKFSESEAVKDEPKFNESETVTDEPKFDESEAVKDEPKLILEQSSLTEEGEDGSKLSVPSIPQGSKAKRGFNKLSADAKPVSAKATGKKVKLKTPSDQNQLSMLSYFGKK